MHAGSMDVFIMKRIRIALLDDHAVVRRGLVNTLVKEAEFEVVGVYERGRDMVAGLATKPADLLLLDFSLSGDETDGISLIRILRIKFPDCHILVFSTYHDPATVDLAMRVGAKGFVSKKAEMTELIRAIREVASGAVYPSADMDDRLALEMANPPEDLSNDSEVNVLAELTAREQEVIRCYLLGMTVSDIADKFNRSIKTISAQRVTAFRKLGVTSDRELFELNKLIGPR